MNFFTTGDISESLGQDRDLISYALCKMGTKPVGRAGLVRLFFTVGAIFLWGAYCD